MKGTILQIQPTPARPAGGEERESPSRAPTAFFQALRPHALAIAMVLFATTVRFLLGPHLGAHNLFELFLGAVFVAAWYGGWKPGALAGVLGLFAADQFFVGSRMTWTQLTLEQQTEAVMYAVSAAVMLVLIEALRRANQHSEEQALRLRAEIDQHQQTQEALQQVKTELQQRVQKRTAQLSAVNTQLVEARARVQRLAALVASSEDAIIGKDIAGVITDWNTGAAHLFGYSADEAIGKRCSRLFSQDDAGEIARTDERLRSGEEVPPYETVRHAKDGKEVPVSVQCSQIKEGDRIIGLSSIIRDLRSTRGLQEQLRHAQKMEAVGQLAGGVAHDFNNLLTIISGYSEVLRSSLPRDDASRGHVEEIRKAAERAASLTRQLLAFSRKQVLEARVVNLNEIVEQSGKMLRRLIGEDVKLNTALSTNLSAVKVDPGQMEQVLMNLAINARDAMPQGGRLTIETGNVEVDESSAAGLLDLCPGRYVQLALSDTGCGMDRHTQARIFEPFFTTKEFGKGTGLGLAVVHGIVKQSGGRIAVYSEPGHGTTFKIYLPTVTVVRKLGKSFQGSDTVPGGKETVLLVEDEEAVRHVTSIALRQAGYNVLQAAHGGEALRLAEETPGAIDLLVSDVVMPEMGGRLLAERLTAVRPGLKVLYVSGYTDDAVVRHGLLHEEVAFLQKPFTLGVLARKVREVLDQFPS
jgi:PAS domain S-box-containing protein